MNRRAETNITLILVIGIFLSAILFSFLLYVSQTAKKESKRTELEAEELSDYIIVVRNVGNNTAKGLTSKPKGSFDKTTVAPGEEVYLTLDTPVESVPVVIIKSEEGSKVVFES